MHFNSHYLLKFDKFKYFGTGTLLSITGLTKIANFFLLSMQDPLIVQELRKKLGIEVVENIDSMDIYGMGIWPHQIFFVWLWYSFLCTWASKSIHSDIKGDFCHDSLQAKPNPSFASKQGAQYKKLNKFVVYEGNKKYTWNCRNTELPMVDHMLSAPEQIAPNDVAGLQPPAFKTGRNPTAAGKSQQLPATAPSVPSVWRCLMPISVVRVVQPRWPQRTNVSCLSGPWAVRAGLSALRLNARMTHGSVWVSPKQQP